MMQLVSCHNGRLYTVNQAEANPAATRSFTTGLPALDALLPGGALGRGAVHEILSDPDHGTPYFFALLLAKAAAQQKGSRAGSRAAPPPDLVPNGAIVCCDPQKILYPPAVAAAGISLHQLFLLRPKTAIDATWAIAECLRCPGVSATVASPGRLSRVEARRLQLAAEKGGGVGLLLRSTDAISAHYAAATRWLICPHPGERTVQKWKVQLIHGHGGLIGKTILLERCRETNHLRAVEELADRSVAAKRATG